MLLYLLTMPFHSDGLTAHAGDRATGPHSVYATAAFDREVCRVSRVKHEQDLLENATPYAESAKSAIPTVVWQKRF